ncbi:DUF6082 family protein [Streptomyces sp. CRN 30]|uniref:DUF6082 family protein n=1 Tax=Streptomyces sp. CRN 30 TaxID=3075613 RepID=UPI002A80492D|nr:DUF6082 family protein [Streptomyces sp. CRN 30]
MAADRAVRETVRFVAWAGATAVGVAVVGIASLAVSGWLIDGVERLNPDEHSAVERSSLGQYFGGVSAVFSGLALILLIVALFYQQKEIRQQREELALQRQELSASRDELRRSAAADLRALHVQLTQLAIEHPALGEVWGDYPGETDEGRRQMLFANACFGHMILAESWGNTTEAELLVNARVLLRSPVFRRYWAATRGVKSQLPPESDEGRVFRFFEQALTELDGNTPPPAR